jgi:hypothetical protein
VNVLLSPSFFIISISFLEITLTFLLFYSPLFFLYTQLFFSSLFFFFFFFFFFFHLFLFILLLTISLSFLDVEMSSTQAKGFHDHYLSPAEAFRNEYYRSHHLSLGEDDDSMLCRPSIDTYTPLIDKEDEDDISDNLSLTDSAHMTLFEPKSPMEPKIVLEDSGKKNDNNTLLSKLSRTTAPMRAKLSTFSKSARNTS